MADSFLGSGKNTKSKSKKTARAAPRVAPRELTVKSIKNIIDEFQGSSTFNELKEIIKRKRFQINEDAAANAEMAFNSNNEGNNIKTRPDALATVIKILLNKNERGQKLKEKNSKESSEASSDSRTPSKKSKKSKEDSDDLCMKFMNQLSNIAQKKGDNRKEDIMKKKINEIIENYKKECNKTINKEQETVIQKELAPLIKGGEFLTATIETMLEILKNNSTKSLGLEKGKDYIIIENESDKKEIPRDNIKNRPYGLDRWLNNVNVEEKTKTTIDNLLKNSSFDVKNEDCRKQLNKLLDGIPILIPLEFIIEFNKNENNDKIKSIIQAIPFENKNLKSTFLYAKLVIFRKSGDGKGKVDTSKHDFDKELDFKLIADKSTNGPVISIKFLPDNYSALEKFSRYDTSDIKYSKETYTPTVNCPNYVAKMKELNRVFIICDTLKDFGTTKQFIDKQFGKHPEFLNIKDSPPKHFKDIIEKENVFPNCTPLKIEKYRNSSYSKLANIIKQNTNCIEIEVVKTDEENFKKLCNSFFVTIMTDFFRKNYIVNNQTIIPYSIYGHYLHTTVADLYDRGRAAENIKLLISGSPYSLKKEELELHSLDTIGCINRDVNIVYNGSDVLKNIDTLKQDGCVPVENNSTLINRINNCFITPPEKIEEKLRWIMYDIKLAADSLCAKAAQHFDCVFVSGDQLAVYKARMHGCDAVLLEKKRENESVYIFTFYKSCNSSGEASGVAAAEAAAVGGPVGPVYTDMDIIKLKKEIAENLFTKLKNYNIQYKYLTYFLIIITRNYGNSEENNHPIKQLIDLNIFLNENVTINDSQKYKSGYFNIYKDIDLLNHLKDPDEESFKDFLTKIEDTQEVKRIIIQIFDQLGIPLPQRGGGRNQKRGGGGVDSEEDILEWILLYLKYLDKDTGYQYFFLPKFILLLYINIGKLSPDTPEHKKYFMANNYSYIRNYIDSFYVREYGLVSALDYAKCAFIGYKQIYSESEKHNKLISYKKEMGMKYIEPGLPVIITKTKKQVELPVNLRLAAETRPAAVDTEMLHTKTPSPPSLLHSPRSQRSQHTLKSRGQKRTRKSSEGGPAGPSRKSLFNHGEKRTKLP
uniref:Uncharacterized protein n=1 Tax=viral metagenome TaxID=1070528 RepID=A0A6C0KUW9_9ZZZZ